MSVFVNNYNWPTYHQWYNYEGKDYFMLTRSFPRPNRMVCEMQDIDGNIEHFVFPYTP